MAWPQTTFNKEVRKQGLEIDLLTLPQRWLANHLVDCYMEFCLPQYPFLHEATFREQYEQIWISDHPPDEILSGTINIVFALGCHFSHGTSSVEAETYFRRAKALILPDLVYKRGDVTKTLQAAALLAMYPQESLGREETWDIVGRMIQLSSCLDLDPCEELDNDEETVRREMNIRLWWACFVLDAVYSSYWGREPRFTEHNKKVNLPQPLRYEDRQASDMSKGSSPQPLISFFVQTIRLCQVMHIVASSNKSTSATEALAIDQQISNWWSELPSSMPAQGSERFQRRLWRQHEVLTSRFLHLRVLLLSRYLKPGPSEFQSITAFAPLKDMANTAIQSLLEDVCVKAAIELLHHLTRLYAVKDGPHSAWWYDLKKITSASEALMLHLTKLADEPFIAEPFYESEDHALQSALKLLHQIDDCGKLQATALRHQLLKQYQAVKEKLQVRELHEGPIQLGNNETNVIVQPASAPGFEIDCNMDFLGGGICD